MYRTLLINANEQIKIHESKDKVQDSTIAEYKTREALWVAKDAIRDSQIANFEKQVRLKDRSLRGQKRKTIAALILGAITTSAATYFAIR